MYSGRISYAYDALDNLHSVTRPNGQSYRYCYNAKWQLEFLRNGPTTACTSGSAATTLTYDAQGNVYQKNEQRYTFTQDNRLRNVANKEYYRYDGHGRRTLSYAPSRGNTLFLYGNDGVLRYMKDNGRARQEDYFYLAGTLVAIRETVGTTTTIKYQHTDALGSPAAVTNAARGVVERSEREPYGKLLNRPIRDGVGFTGHVEDALTGSTYMQQRYFDSDIVRFLSVDPMTVDPATAWNFNRFNYAAGNPFKFTDPDGRAIDLIADIGFIAYSGYLLATEPSWTNAAALGADVIGAAVPFATGLGSGVRAAAHGADAAKAAKGTTTAGRYEFPDKANDGTPYVGQACNCERRLSEHKRAGRYEPGTATVTPVEGGKTAREISEHNRIQELTGGVPARQSDAVSNKVDPIGTARAHLLEEKRDEPR
jgi:RHS repeat-associated protein